MRPIAIRICEYRLAWPWRSLSGSKMSWETWSTSAPQRSRMSAQRSITASSNSISTISPVMPGAQDRASLFSTSANGFGVVVAHRHQAMAGEDEGDRRGARHVGVGLAHQRRRHVARAVLDIEAAGNLDLLHVLPGRHRDPGQPLHRLVLLGGRLDEVDPDRVLRQRSEIDGDGLLQREVGGNEHRQHGATPEQGYATAPSRTKLDSGKGFDDRRINRRSSIYGDWMAAAWPRFGDRCRFAQKISRNRKTCGKKATAGVPQRGTGI